MATTTTSEDALLEVIRERILASRPSDRASEMPPVQPERPPGRLHYKFPLLLAAVKAGVDGVALVGPAATGKSSAARQAASMLNRSFEAVSFGPTTSKSDLFGFIDANGVYRETGLVRAARDGAVFLGDEFDAGHPGVAVGLNMLTANGHFATPIGMVQKHAQFVCIVAMNTYGQGANRQYVGRNQMDAATLDRFAVIDWDLDHGLEAEMCGVPGVPSSTLDVGEGGVLSTDAWLRRVWTIRAAVEALGIRHLVSPRCSQSGTRLFSAGVGRTHVEEMVLWKGLDRDSRSRIEANAKELA